MTVPELSPCRKQCRLDTTQTYCTGCGRTRPEIATWRRMSTPERQAIMDALPQRRTTLDEIQP